MRKVYVFLADGFEEIEGLTVVDILRRAGVEVCMVSVTGKRMIRGSHHIGIEADALFEECDFADADILVLPGGMPGTRHLGEHAGLTALLKEFHEAQRGIAAICAAPSVLGDLGLLEGKTALCYPGFEERLIGARIADGTVVTDGHITTSRGMGTAIDFALELTRRLCGAEKANELAATIMYA
ncbi:MAG: DJ-1/PfpI family protein [Eubacteriales bacterium]|nr:DJ-1/PfpI family protein [Eubacteriales bacterium]